MAQGNDNSPQSSYSQLHMSYIGEGKYVWEVIGVKKGICGFIPKLHKQRHFFELLRNYILVFKTLYQAAPFSHKQCHT
jgi:hypothetical protein